MVNVFIITQNEPFYIPKMVKYLLEKQQGYKITGATVLSPTRKNKRFKDWLSERIKIYTFFELFIVGFSFIYSKVINVLFKKSSPYSNTYILKKHNIELIETQDINSLEYIDKLRARNIDIIISISCPQLFGEDLLNVANRYSINAHGTLLPRHRGVFGSFWTLYDNDEFAGSTIHTMELKLDAGQILWQKAFPVKDVDTQFSIAYKTKKDMAMGLVYLLYCLVNCKQIDPVEPKFESSYHRAPTKQHARSFRKQGRRIVKVKDVMLMLKPSF